MTDLPHFSLPFRFTSPYAAVTEQDSIDEIGDCVLAILSCPIGFREELPQFGIEDLTFTEQPLDTEDLAAVIDTWEPRASVLFDQHPGTWDEMVARVQTYVRVRTES